MDQTDRLKKKQLLHATQSAERAHTQAEAAAKGQLGSRPNNGTSSAGGVEGGVATEGPVILSDLLIPPALSQKPPLAAIQSGHMGNIRGRSVPADKRRHLYVNAFWGFHRGQRRTSRGMKCAAPFGEIPRRP